MDLGERHHPGSDSGLTRFGGALPAAIGTTNGHAINLFLLNLAIVEGDLPDIDPRALESWVVESLDRRRYATGMLETHHRPDEEHSMTVGRLADDTIAAFDDDAPIASPESRGERDVQGDADDYCLTCLPHR